MSVVNALLSTVATTYTSSQHEAECSAIDLSVSAAYTISLSTTNVFAHSAAIAATEHASLVSAVVLAIDAT